MENYRNNLVEQLKNTPKEERGDVLNSARETEEYKESEKKHQDEKMLHSEQVKLYEKYKELIQNIKQEALHKAIEYGHEDDPVYIDSSALSKLYHKLREDNADLTSTLALMRKFPNTGIIEEANLARDGVYSDDSEIFNSSKEVLLHRAIFSEETKNVLLESILRKTHGNPVLNKIEALSYLGVTPNKLDKIKQPILESGDMILIEKLCDDFSISLTEKELLSLSEKALDKESLYDLTRIIEKIPNPDNKIVLKKKELLERAEKNYSLNKQKIVTGLKNKDMLLHFSKRKNLSSILKNGVLSLDEQRNQFGAVEMGEGPDMQEILGRHDCVSVYNLYKGASGEYDEKLYEEMKNKITKLIYDFQWSYPERVFLLGGYGTRSSDTIHISPEDTEKNMSKFSKSIYVSKKYNFYIDPTDVSTLTSLNVLECENDTGKCSIEKRRNGQPIFTELFFENMNDQKKKLLDEIKDIMKSTYNTSIKNKDFSEINSKRLANAFGQDDEDSTTAEDRSTFILDPNLEKSFAMSMYYNESFVDEKITPDKIVGVKLTDKYTEKECYDSGKVGFRVLINSKEEKVSTDNREIIFNDGGVSVYTENPYKF